MSLSHWANYLQEYAQVMCEVTSVLSEDLLSAAELKSHSATAHPTTGHCYVAAEALYHLIGGTDSGFKPTVAKLKGPPTSGTHWWLSIPGMNEILDPTAAQFDPRDLDEIYASGRCTGFLTKQPSKRAAEVIRRVEALRKRL